MHLAGLGSAVAAAVSIKRERERERGATMDLGEALGSVSDQFEQIFAQVSRVD